MNNLAFGAGDGLVTRFELPEVTGVLLGDFDGASVLPTAADLEEMHRQAYAEGFNSGRAEGERRGAADVQRRVDTLKDVLSQLSVPLATLDQELVDEVAQLALLIARHLVRRELKTEPGEVVGVVRETIRLLPVASRGTTLRLNPDDIELVRPAFALDSEGFSWRVEADPLVARGGCIVETEASRIDATVESRLAAIASKMFGGERGSDREA